MPGIHSKTSLLKLIEKQLSRRDLIKVGGQGLSVLALAGGVSACGGSGSAPSAGKSRSATIPRPSAEYSVLMRTSFGPNQAAMSEILDSGIDPYLSTQLAYESIDVSELEASIAAAFPLSTQNADTLIDGFPDNIQSVAIQMASATQYRQMFSPRQLYEVMVEFWSDHFNIHLVNGLGPTLKPDDDRNVIRAHALGNFGDLLRASAKSPAMLFYLDNYNNLVTAPNENYARELMELHTLGVDGGYTENDIKEVARCFTGWTLNFPWQEPYGQFNYQSAWHDDGEKEVLGETIAAGGGISDGDQVLDILLAHPSTATFIATKLCQRFISDNPPASIVAEVAAAFSASNGDIKTSLRVIFASQVFLDSQDTRLTRPSEFLARIARGLGSGSLPSDNGQLFYFAQAILGQLPFFWPTPDGFPSESSYWASTGGMLNRWRMSFLSLAPVLPEIDVFDIDYETLTNGARTLNDIISGLEANVLMRSLSGKDRRIITKGLEEGYGGEADQELSPEEAQGVAALVAAVLISSAYFQLR